MPLIEPKKKKSHKGRWFFLFLVFLLFFIVFSNGPQQDKNANTAAQKPAASLPLPQKIATKEEIAAIPKEPDASGKRDPKRQALATTKSREYDSGKQALMLVLAEKAVRNKLKDPESAQFKNVYFSMGSDNLPMVCGQVNAKNAMGGFTGFEYFISNGLPQTTYLQSEIEDVETAWNRFCAK